MKYIFSTIPYFILLIILFFEIDHFNLLESPMDSATKFILIFYGTLLSIAFVALVIIHIRWIKADMALKRTQALLKERKK